MCFFSFNKTLDNALFGTRKKAQYPKAGPPIDNNAVFCSLKITLCTNNCIESKTSCFTLLIDFECESLALSNSLAVQ